MPGAAVAALQMPEMDSSSQYFVLATLDTTTDSYNFTNANAARGIRVSGDMNVTGGLNVGASVTDTHGNVGITPGSDSQVSDKFYIYLVNGGNVTIGDDIRFYNNFNRDFVLSAYGSNHPINVNIGGAIVNGTQSNITFSFVDNFSIASSMSSFGGLTIGAQTADMHSVTNFGGVFSISVTGDADFNGCVVQNIAGSESTNISVGSLGTIGDLANGTGAGTMTFTVSHGDMQLVKTDDNEITGSISHSADLTTVNVPGGKIIAPGTVKNDSLTGELKINAGGMDITGGDELNPTLVNKGVFTGIITGDTYLKYGIYSANDFLLTSSGAVVFGDTSSLNNTGTMDITASMGNSYLGAIRNGTIDTSNAQLAIRGDVIGAQSLLNYGDTVAITANTFDVAGNINTTQNAKTNITARNLMAGAIETTGETVIVANDINVVGDVSGGVEFFDVEKMHIGGNYIFNDASILGVRAMDSSKPYWSDVSLTPDGTLGQITNKSGGTALVTVNGAFISDLGTGMFGDVLDTEQFRVSIFETVDASRAIWLLHADSGLNNVSTNPRNISMLFCNADRSICFDYIPAAYTTTNGILVNGENENMPVYLSLRDSDSDGITDSLYIVFDSRFGGPVTVQPIAPIVARTTDDDTPFGAARALDALVDSGLRNAGFNNPSQTPIEAISLSFRNTQMERIATELYLRLEDYSTNFDGNALTNFSRLVSPTEAEQLIASVALDEHTFPRDFEDRMFDEFIWNRNRKVRKAWIDADFGMFVQNVADGVRHAHGNRFSLMGGYDTHASNTLIVGGAARVSHSAGHDTGDVDLSYATNRITGHIDTDVTDTDIGVGAYLMKILGNRLRVYGNAFVDLHLLDASREQTYVENKISGDAMSFAVTSEWGLMHDILNQYIVGNLYARVGYNFGFDINEKSGGNNYMKIKSDGYTILTPGYSLIAQKRIYPSMWFQIRPYVSIGAEYDVLGTNENIKIKFAAADEWSNYDAQVNPLWANIGGGVEMSGASGIHVGLDYRYQYNSTIQLHNIKLSAMYRF